MMNRNVKDIPRELSRAKFARNNGIFPAIVESNDTHIMVQITHRNNVQVVIEAIPIYPLGVVPSKPAPGTHVLLLVPTGNPTEGAYILGQINLDAR